MEGTVDAEQEVRERTDEQLQLAKANARQARERAELAQKRVEQVRMRLDEAKAVLRAVKEEVRFLVDAEHRRVEEFKKSLQLAKAEAARAYQAAIEAEWLTEEWQVIGGLRVRGGLAVDMDTGLMWMRCSLGMVWDGSAFLGEALRYTLKEALDTAKEADYAGYQDWRLPTQKELESLWAKFDPKVFPRSKGAYWSFPPDIHGASYVDFNNQCPISRFRDYYRSVRLVRNDR